MDVRTYVVAGPWSLQPRHLDTLVTPTEAKDGKSLRSIRLTLEGEVCQRGIILDLGRLNLRPLCDPWLCCLLGWRGPEGITIPQLVAIVVIVVVRSSNTYVVVRTYVVRSTYVRTYLRSAILGEAPMELVVVAIGVVVVVMFTTWAKHPL